MHPLDPIWIVTRGGHERQEFIVGTEERTVNNDIWIQVYNTTTEKWGNLLQVGTSLSNAAFRAFDIAYEDVSGDALIVYETRQHPLS